MTEVTSFHHKIFQSSEKFCNKVIIFTVVFHIALFHFLRVRKVIMKITHFYNRHVVFESISKFIKPTTTYVRRNKCRLFNENNQGQGRNRNYPRCLDYIDLNDLVSLSEPVLLILLTIDIHQFIVTFTKYNTLTKFFCNWKSISRIDNGKLIRKRKTQTKAFYDLSSVATTHWIFIFFVRQTSVLPTSVKNIQGMQYVHILPNQFTCVQAQRNLHIYISRAIAQRQKVDKTDNLLLSNFVSNT